MGSRSIQVFFPVFVWLVFHGAMAGGEEPEDPTTRDYLLAANMQNNLLFELAIPHWKEVIAKSPDKRRVEKARYYLAVCCYYERNFEDTLTQVKTLLDARPAGKDGNSDLRRNAIALMAASHLQRREKEEARKALALFRKEFPEEDELAKQIENGKYPLTKAELQIQKTSAALPK